MRWRLAYLCLIVAAAAIGEPTPLVDLPSPDRIADTADRLLEGSAYTIEDTSLYTFRILEWIGDRIQQLLRWLDDVLGLGEFLGSLTLGTIRVIVVVSFAILLAILIYNGYVLYKMRRVPEESFVTLGPARTVTAAEVLAEAQRLSAEGNYVDASRRLFLAALLLLEEKRNGRLRQSLTNTEYLHSFRTDWVRENLGVFVDLIDWKWYRHQSFDADDFRRCRTAFETIAARLDEMEA